MLKSISLVNRWFRWRLKSPRYRHAVYQKALARRLSGTRSGRQLLRVLRHVMAEHPEYHDEVRRLLPEANYHHEFWNSDFGFLWFDNAFHVGGPNPYVDYVVARLAAGGYATHLDVGCGWGKLCAAAAQTPGIARVKGIDINPNVVARAAQEHRAPVLEFACADVRAIDETFDLVSCVGVADYFPPDQFESIVQKLISLAKQEMILVHSLRSIAFETADALTEATLVRRYDEGWVHPVRATLQKLADAQGFEFEVRRYGPESLLAHVRVGAAAKARRKASPHADAG